MLGACREPDPARNPGVSLGLAIGTLAKAGRDKLTFLADDEIASFGAWARAAHRREHRQARRRDRPGRPRAARRGRRLRPGPRLRPDRAGRRGRRRPRRARRRRSRRPAIRSSGSSSPTRSTSAPSSSAGRSRRRSPGAVLGHRPVRPAERRGGQGADPRPCSRGTAEPGATAAPPPTPIAERRRPDPVRRRGAPADRRRRRRRRRAGPPPRPAPAERLPRASRRSSPRRPARDAAIARIRALLRDRTGRATTAGYGPRFLHSTGQLHKGGAPIGWFLQLTADHPVDRRDPGLAVHLRPAHRRPGGRRLRRHRVARPADPAGPPRRRPGRRAGRPRAGARPPALDASHGGLTAMRIGFIGLGRMGANMVRRLVRDGHEIVVYNRTPEKTTEIAGEGATASFSIAELVAALEKPRAVWIMVPAGDATEAQIARAARAPRAGRHDHRRRQHELPRRRPPPRGRSRRRASTTSTPARRAGSGASRSATA